MTGQELKSLRKNVGLKAYELASELGYGSAQWSAFENDKAPIPKVVEYAARWVCRRGDGTVASPGDKLIQALKEAMA